MWRNAVTTILIGALAAEVAGAIAVLVVTRDLETVGLGLLVPLLLMPSVVLYVLARNVDSLIKWAGWFYWVPASVLAIAFVYVWLVGSESSGMAGLVMAVLVVASFVGYVILRYVSGQYELNRRCN